LVQEALHRDLQHLLADLTEQERDVILILVWEMVSHSLAEIGRALDLSRERVRQIESKALQKLRQQSVATRYVTI